MHEQDPNPLAPEISPDLVPPPAETPPSETAPEEPAPMLDVHPAHHAAQSWRDFFIHIATIVIGLLIAIGLEQTVEYVHHRRLVTRKRAKPCAWKKSKTSAVLPSKPSGSITSRRACRPTSRSCSTSALIRMRPNPHGPAAFTGASLKSPTSKPHGTPPSRTAPSSTCRRTKWSVTARFTPASAPSASSKSPSATPQNNPAAFSCAAQTYPSSTRLKLTKCSTTAHSSCSPTRSARRRATPGLNTRAFPSSHPLPTPSRSASDPDTPEEDEYSRKETKALEDIDVHP